jgi:hypothetical protein
VPNRCQFRYGAVVGFATPLSAEAQPPGSLYRLGFLRNGLPSETFIEDRQGLSRRRHIRGRAPERFLWDTGSRSRARPSRAPELTSRAWGTEPYDTRPRSTRVIRCASSARIVWWRSKAGPMTYGFVPDNWWTFQHELRSRGIAVSEIERVELRLRPPAESAGVTARTVSVTVTLRSGRVDSWVQQQSGVP